MSELFKLISPIGRSYEVEPSDVRRVKQVLLGLGYYSLPTHGLTDYPDRALFEGIEQIQNDHGLQADGVMKPGGPTEKAINHMLSSEGGEIRDPGNKMPQIVPPNVDPKMPTIKNPIRPRTAPYVDEHGNIILEGRHPKTGFPISPPKES